MTINTELPLAIEHKTIQRIHQQQHLQNQQQYHYVHHLLQHHHHNHHHHHHENHSNQNQPQTNNNHHYLKTESRNTGAQLHNEQHQSLLLTRKTTTKQAVAPIRKNSYDQQQHANHSRQSTLERARQKSQIRFFLIAAFAYILSPIDLIPEAIFGVIGILDDLLFLFTCLFCVAIILIYPLFREAQRTILYKLGLLGKQAISNKTF